jgi:hypothetical protein
MAFLSRIVDGKIAAQEYFVDREQALAAAARAAATGR